MEANGTAAETNVVGAVLEGRYRVEAPLARGGMSSVFRGTDLRLDRPVAIKVMESKFAGDQSFIDRFELEARAAARLHHPCVVAVHDQGVDGDHVYLVMELVDGGNLRDLLRERGALPPAVALGVLDPVLAALASAHRAGLVHRDVKPENVLIGPGGMVKVADFGLVRAIADAGVTSDSVILGTVAYLSPEQVTTGKADARSDVYAAGVMLYEMLTGAPPYLADTPISVAYQHVNEDMPPPSESVAEIPPSLDDLVLRATRRDPAQRPADAFAFLGELVRTRDLLGLPRVPVPLPKVAHQSSDPADLEVNRTGPLAPRGVDDPTTVARGSDAESTVRTPPVRPGPVGPQGTRAISRAELGVPVGAGTPVGPPPGRYPPPPVPPPVNPYQAQRVRSRRTFLIWILVVLLLATVVGVGAWWLGSGRWTAVPQVAGLDVTSAEQALQQAHLTPNLTRTHDNTVAAGRVIGTEPAIGQRTLRGSEVTVLVSEGRPVVPDVTPGASVAAAQQAIRAAQLQPRTDPGADTYDATVAKGLVLKVMPTPGTQMIVNGPVTIILSKGPPPKPVPNVVGQPHDQAFAALQQAGFQPVDQPSVFNGQVAGGSVVQTNPPAGTVIAPDGNHQVGVTVSNAVTVPNLTGQNANAAAAQLQALHLQVQIQALLNNGNGNVFTQAPAPGSLVAPGSTVVLGVFP